jgi:uncharacterized protein YndB with AHSA1/START domain
MSNNTTTSFTDRRTAVVTVTVAAPLVRAFAALTEPALVREWFGELYGSLEAGGTARLDFGDGDFFAIEDVSASPPTELTYRWRLLGVSSADLITWRLEPAGNSTVVTVSDWNEERDPESNRELEEGWRDFTDRLVGYLATGTNTRYDWSRSFSAAIELPVPINAARRLLSDDASLWLPLSVDRLRLGATLHLADASDPTSFAIEAVSIDDAPPAVHVSISSPDWRRPTESTIALQSRGDRTTLTVTHVGWTTVAADPAVQKRYRRRFAAMWLAALHRAKALFPAQTSSAAMSSPQRY